MLVTSGWAPSSMYRTVERFYISGPLMLVFEFACQLDYFYAHAETIGLSLPKVNVNVYIYRPQRSCEGYVFTGVCLSTGGVPGPGGVPVPGGSASGGCLLPGRVPAPDGCLVWGFGLVSQHALRQTPRERRLLLRTVRILLECHSCY